MLWTLGCVGSVRRVSESKREVRNFINGESVDSADGRRLDLVDPTTGEVFGSSPISSAEDVDRAYAAASTAFETWRDTTPSERQRMMLKFADALEERAEEIIAAECQNTGKPIEMTRTEEMPPSLDQIPSSPAPPACSRDAARGSTWPGTRPTSVVSRWASSAR